MCILGRKQASGREIMQHPNCGAIGWMPTPAERKCQTEFHAQGQDWAQTADEEAGFVGGRILRATDVAPHVCFLLGDESAMQTGSIVEIHDGWLREGQ